MIGLGLLIPILYPTAKPREDFSVLSELGVSSIEYWNEAKLGPKPTIEFLESKRAEAEAFFAAQEKAKQFQASQLDIANNHIVELTKMVMELRAKAEAKGETLTPVSAELVTKIAAVETLKAEVVAEKEIAVEDGPVPMLPP